MNLNDRYLIDSIAATISFLGIIIIAAMVLRKMPDNDVSRPPDTSLYEVDNSEYSEYTLEGPYYLQSEDGDIDVVDANGRWVACFESEDHANLFIRLLNEPLRVQVHNLYSKTGDIKDINTLLINRNDLATVKRHPALEIVEL